jgi:hypothetical protein
MPSTVTEGRFLKRWKSPWIGGADYKRQGRRIGCDIGSLAKMKQRFHYLPNTIVLLDNSRHQCSGFDHAQE